MADQRWKQTWEIFHDALERGADTRLAFIESACGNDAALREEVIGLLDAHDSDAAFLETPAAWLGGGGDPDELETGSRLGPYVIRRLVGSGGMGVVYEAAQDGIDRRVALKLIRAGMASREMIARFALERRTLALMNHPNIATAYDVGASDDGRHYIAMEFVDGRPLTQFCDAAALTLAQRIDLFLQVCDAIEHAHQKGILHRDLKPSNVIAGRDGGPEGGRVVLKVIDFGVAKATGPAVDRRSFVTQVGRFIGTPEYMSPEQAGASNIDVDTRADIYSLGVMLYELLAGVLPVDPERLRSASLAEIECTLFVEELPRPSRRAVQPARARELRGDLDWIIGRAMERDRERRYPSVSEFAADLRRYLAHEPVVAGPPDVGYRVRKFVRRHRGAVAAAAILVLMIAAFVVSLILSNARTERALQEARVERERSNEVSSFLLNLFRVSKPTTAQANAVTAREMLDQGAADIRARLKNQPEVQARLMETMGEVYTNLGVLDEAETLLLDSLDVRRRTLGPEHREVAATLARLGRLDISRGNYQSALAHHREALAIYRRAQPQDLSDVSNALLNEGAALRALADFDTAERSLRECIAIRREQMKQNDELVAEALMHLGGIAMSRGKLDDAVKYREEAADLRLRILGEDHIDVARSRNDLANVYFQQGQDAKAEAIYRKVLATDRGVLGPEHPDTATAMNNLAAALRRQGKLDEAEELARGAVAIRRKQSGDQHPETAVALNQLALTIRAKGDPAAAAVFLREAVSIMRGAFAPTHPSVVTTVVNLGEVLHEAGAPDAIAVLEEALALRQKSLPAGNLNIAVSMAMLAHARADRGENAAAEQVLREALASMTRTQAADHPRVAQTKAYLGGVLIDLRKKAEGVAMLRESEKILEKTGSAHDREYARKALAKAGA